MKKINFQYECAIKLQHVSNEIPLDTKRDNPFWYPNHTLIQGKLCNLPQFAFVVRRFVPCWNMRH